MTQRCIIVRHGQTEWSKSGQYTGLTDLPLTDFGVKQMQRTGRSIFRDNSFVNPEHVTYIFTSPRLRARQTIDLVLETLTAEQRANIRIVVDEDLREWEYGDYEGLLTHEIVALRKSRGLDKTVPWNIWRDGCENGENTKQVGLRLSRAIARIQNLHKASQDKKKCSDIMVFAHGHVLRYFAALWFRKLSVEQKCNDEWERVNPSSYKDDTVPYVQLETYRYLNDNPFFLLDAGGIGVLSYAHNSIDEPALALAGAFVPPPEEQSQHEEVQK
ncbi:similar to Saccharomyces cerevisiae YKR043C Sedoheptulose bisphosphatase involved in riboneogenesis [Maudiozyma barnettii]|uniref:Similar to Saccharomyces cerevisiae YKR043C Sedoheptulose bisphosphatase involved in riboneogenesis n=1 Tax=Maudiozyma barnettii TaxID=61262 RepID=A0A8H2VFK1_9SACH|nr:sedoheptulose-bisphosphatase [Kazachstania barnettii]CAB4254595.1 similar to Saccharomyces cerevisiae YKR043C Sedoheptulose bisphosphatase involved in riboneogenesis [Kazachstania barnettii]CAD1782637.1 similar to Saccharomyces cerevisiae YKR043C Sedoheptulose bisphosphatase involved in riboneogenesis [Kazachstania barnettii]